jgi:hypothetical protein
VSVQSTQTSIKRGHTATYVVQISTENGGSASGVSVTLAADPSTQKPTFTSGCTKGDTTASCTVGAVSDQKPVALHAQIPVASSATSVTSLTLTATASIVTTAKWTPPSADETIAVTAATPSPSASKSSAGTATQTVLPLGPLPNLNNVSSSLIGAGNAAGLFPAITPGATTATPTPSAGTQTQDAKRNTESVSYSSTLGPVMTAQIAGLIALALAIMLTVTRLSVVHSKRRR